MTPWIGTAFRHIRADAGREPLDLSFAGAFARNRWTDPGVPTLYLAGDLGVVVAEWGRQMSTAIGSDVPTRTIARDVYRFHLRLDAVLDLRDPEVTASIGRSDAPQCFMDIEQARSTSGLLRAVTSAQALVVPSIAFLDDMTRWNLVVFLEKLPAEPTEWIHRVEPLGPLRWR